MHSPFLWTLGQLHWFTKKSNLQNWKCTAWAGLNSLWFLQPPCHHFIKEQLHLCGRFSSDTVVSRIVHLLMECKGQLTTNLKLCIIILWLTEYSILFYGDLKLLFTLISGQVTFCFLMPKWELKYDCKWTISYVSISPWLAHPPRFQRVSVWHLALSAKLSVIFYPVV